MFSFKCAVCNDVHEGMPSFGADAPLSYFAIPKDERDQRCTLRNDDCVIDKDSFFVRGCLEIPVVGESEPFIWGVWVSLSEASYAKWVACYELEKRAHAGPFFGWLDAWLSPYPETMNLKTKVHLRDNEVRPYIELQPTEHPLSMEQRNGINVERVAELGRVRNFVC